MKDKFIVGVIVTIQILVSAFTQLYIIRVIGIGPETDIYIASLTIPAIITAMTTIGLQNIWLPRLSIFIDDHKTWRSEQAIAQGQAAIIGICFFLFVSISASFWLPAIFPGFNSEQQDTIILYSFLMLITMIFNIQSALLVVALRAIDRFIVSEVIILVGSLISLTALYFFLPEWGLLGAVYITLVRSILVYIVQLYFAKWPSISIVKALSAKEMWSLLKPLLATRFLGNSSPLVDRYFASQGVSGSITLLNLAQIAMGALSSILEKIICMPIVPKFARQIEQNDYIGLRNTYRYVLLQIFIAIAFIGVILILSKPLFISLTSSLLNLEYNTGYLLWTACIILLGFLFAGVSGGIVSPVFYAMKDTKTPSIIFLIGFLLSIPIKSFAFIYFDIIGLIYAISAYYLINFIASIIVLEKNVANKITKVHQAL